MIECKRCRFAPEADAPEGNGPPRTIITVLYHRVRNEGGERVEFVEELDVACRFVRITHTVRRWVDEEVDGGEGEGEGDVVRRRLPVEEELPVDRDVVDRWMELVRQGDHEAGCVIRWDPEPGSVCAFFHEEEVSYRVHFAIEDE